MRRPFAILALLLGCLSSAPPAADTTPEPQLTQYALDGQVLYARPADEVPPRVSEGWDFYQQAWASEPPEPPEGAGVDAFRQFVTQQFAPYVDQQAQAAAQFLGAWEEASEPAEQLFYAVLGARLLHRASSWMWELPVPDEEGMNPAARQAFEQSLRGAAKDLAGYATQAFGKCVEAAGAAPASEQWAADCDRRAEALEPIRTAQIGPPPPTPMPEGCEDHTDPMFAAPQHDPEARPQLLVIVEAESEEVDTAAVQRAVERWARSEHDMRAVPAGRRRAAERLVEAGKTSRRGPECAAPPSLSWVLGAQVEHLVVAKVRHRCGEAVPMNSDLEPTGEARMTCRVIVSWHRAGSAEDDGLPPTRFESVPVEADTEAVIERVTNPPGEGSSTVIGSMRPSGADGVRVRIAAVGTNPGFRLRSELMELELHTCQIERGASQLQLGWTVTPTGAVESVSVQGGDEAMNSCVREKLQQLTLPCTPSGDPLAMQTTLCLAR